MNRNFFKGFIGTYTDKESKGIYNFVFDCQEKKFTSISLAYEIEKPSYLAIDKTNNILYAVSKKDDAGGITSFKINDDLSLDKINSRLEPGNPPCYINCSHKTGLVFTANYHHNKINVYPVLDNHEIGEPITTLTHDNLNPHIHYADFDPSGDFLISIDLGQDFLNLYEVKDNTFIEREDLKVKFSKGCGPRHLAFHPNGEYVYVITEISCEIVSFKYSKGKFILINITSTLPNKYLGVKAGAAIHIHPTGKFLYASTRGHNSIACYKINETTGDISLIGHKPTFGSCPRDFSISKDGKYLFVGNQDSSSLIAFEINEETGRLMKLIDSIDVPSPVCIKFL